MSLYKYIIIGIYSFVTKISRTANIDKHINCRNWANQGECRINPSYMLSNCHNSCKYKDKNMNCKIWALESECIINPLYMLSYCPQSCKKE